MANNIHFDYIIIGNGLAGLQLALKMNGDIFFKKKRIALIDASNKNTNDKTWSFWETSPGKWDHLVKKAWTKASIITSKKSINLKLFPYYYKTIRAIDFYNNTKNTLLKNNKIEFLIEHVDSVNDSKNLTKVFTKENSYTTNHLFDSRIPEVCALNSKKNISLIQHFKGWVIKTEKKVFDTDSITMMDYRLKDGNQTSFTYVLPFSKTEALIEFTYFNSHIVENITYDRYIKKYIKDCLKIDNYSIIETEKGQIPMTNFSFEKFNTSKITKIGTGGGWVKGSTGYSFKHTEKKVEKIINNIKSNKIPSENLSKSRFKFYDKIFLKVLRDENHKGEWIFEQFYTKNSIQTMFRFLDEESNFMEELKIMRSLLSWTFIKAFFKTL